ncbi:tRNA dimethylallyltransferase KNAG_0J01860 [Huiozyma naganishii CBS 8797]|uniref:tRNA dimethylallyltransferase n=1 Tax=Huiozyma naganishii (strain ATCC MYA-139 / BCRC 22969 / CBS 8797 / KCTC 17520 / NBRC 10181 / NCYC 3082 / Yp74L-3) TaxID=1071383 RepID=J7S2V8_HUIN7|nr:hypothetical protein KNAG_0J01860 [Kazachstania naganishii CBS 8797]CCK72267.1 hypothetical protein KNAG_0J01860 [Kazachstania naganishii CBS 8797]
MATDVRKKILAIVGTTGVGKSDLSIELAERFNGEVINADSMQMYKDVPIITNKHPLVERRGIPHHVMNHVPWDEEYFIHRFEKECLERIEDILERGKVPIIVGGTHYYLQILFNKVGNSVTDSTRAVSDEENKILNSENSNLIYSTLQKLDPEIASKYHPNDLRRLRRMLEIFYTTGTKPSETFKQQKLTLKYNTIFLWLYSTPLELNKRLDDRVDKMLDSGGMQEINQLFEYYKRNKLTPELMENGVWQVIGFKEFLPWLENPEGCELEECVERMKIRTRQYSRRQVKWIQKMLVPDINGEGIFLLNATDLTKWHFLVCDRAVSITEQFLKDELITAVQAPEELAALLLRDQTFERKKHDDYKHFICTICKTPEGENLTAIGEKSWNIHLRSRRHRKNLTRGSKKAEYEKWKAENGE